MAGIMDNVKTINSAVRTILLISITGIVGFGGWTGYRTYIAPGFEARQARAELEAIQAEFAAQQIELEAARLQNQRLEISLKLHKIDRRVANVEILKKGQGDDGQNYVMARFSEIDELGNIIGSARDFTLKGDKVYIDGWVTAFEDKYIENADELRSVSLFVFKSIYGDAEKPKDGQRLDTQSTSQIPPGIYHSERKNQFEQKIWEDFWNVCNDRKKQQELGIRASHGLVGYFEAVPGNTYQISMRANGGMSLRLTQEH